MMKAISAFHPACRWPEPMQLRRSVCYHRLVRSSRAWFPCDEKDSELCGGRTFRLNHQIATLSDMPAFRCAFSAR